MSAEPPPGGNGGGNSGGDGGSDESKTRGFGFGDVETVLSVDEVSRQAEEIAVDRPDRARLLELTGGAPLLAIEARSRWACLRVAPCR